MKTKIIFLALLVWGLNVGVALAGSGVLGETVPAAEADDCKVVNTNQEEITTDTVAQPPAEGAKGIELTGRAASAPVPTEQPPKQP